MDSFKIFAENTKPDFFLISFGLLLLGSTSFINIVIKNKLTMFIKIIGVIIISYAAFILLTQLKIFYDFNPNFFLNSPYKQNIYAGFGLCSILFVIIIYTTYTIFF